MAQLIQNFVGHTEVKNWLLAQAKNQSLPSSLIFHGPEGVGKKTLALAILQLINCRSSQEGACGECSHCHRVEEERNEMVFHLHPEAKKSIGVDQVREMQSFFQLKSSHPARFAIIDPADSLTVPAANSLLKVLEEPSEATHFILITEQIRSLLPTIRSRSHLVKFKPLEKKELLEHRSFNDLALQWSDGRLQMALDLQSDEKITALNESIQFLYSLLCEPATDWKKKAPWFFNDEAARDFCFRIWKQAFEKRLYGLSENLDFIPVNPGQISRLFSEMELLQGEIKSHVDKLLAVENFYYRARPAMMSS